MVQKYVIFLDILYSLSKYSLLGASSRWISTVWSHIGERDVDYPTILRNLRDNRCDVVLSLATHFLPASGSRLEAMQTNYANIRRLIGELS